MALHYRTCGFVIKKRDSGETDRIFTFLTKDFGKINIQGKAIRKIASKLKGGVDPTAFLEIEFIQGKAYKTLTDAIVVKNFKEIKKDLSKLRVVDKMGEILSNLSSKEERDENVFNLLKTTYSKLDDPTFKDSLLPMVYFYFVWNLFSLLGFKPEVYKCTSCRGKLNPRLIYFSSIDGGVVCGHCSSRKKECKPINTDVVKILRLILKRSWDTLSKLKTPIASQKLMAGISRSYYLHLLSVHLSGDELIKR